MMKDESAQLFAMFTQNFCCIKVRLNILVSKNLKIIFAIFGYVENDLNSSLIYAQESQNLSKEKIWTLNEIFTDKGEETIFRASSKLIYECLMRMINDTKLDKLETAIDLCKLALDTAISGKFCEIVI